MMKFLSTSKQWGLFRFYYLIAVVCVFLFGTETTQAQIDIQPQITHVGCNGQNNGSVTLVITGGTGPYEVVWLGTGGTGLTESGLDADTHNYSVLDLGDPTMLSPIYQQVTITEPDVLIAQFTDNSDPNCHDACDGTATLYIEGGTEPYSFDWPAGAIVSPDGLTASGLCAGTVAFNVTDANLCSSAASQALEPQDPIVASTTASVNPTCAGDDGTASVTVVDGEAPYTYLWSNGETTQTIENLTPGTYTVDIVDSNGCEANAEAVLTGTTSTMVVTIDPTFNITCFGANDGSATANVTGGTAPFTYVWSSGTASNDGASSTATGLLPGPGSVIITDDNGCEETIPFNIIEPDVIVISIDGTTDVGCPGDANGNILVSATGGSGTFTYTYVDASTNTPVTPGSLAGGNYIVTAIDSANPSCTATETFTINEPTPIVLTVDATEVSCFGLCDAIATPTVTGGAEPITVDWGGFDPNALCVGSYTATATDANNCSVSFPFDVTGPEAITLNVTATEESCFGACDAVATPTITGGVDPVTVDWGGFDPNALCVGSYTATATDANNCSISFPFDVTGPDAISLSVTATQESCFGACDAIATPTIIGGVEPITVDWGGFDPNALCVGSYTATATDANNCSASFPFDVTGPDAITLNVTATQESCFGACDAVATPTTTGGVEPITIDWGGADPNALCVGSYTATATDANNCSVSFPFDVTGPESITLSVNATQESCFGACDAVATPTVSGGVEPVTLDWGGFDPNALCVGSYTATATDANNCSISFPFDVTGPEAITLSVVATEESCFGACDAVATPTITGGVEPISVDWGGFDPNALCVGSYTATASDANNCSISFPFDVTGPAAITLNVTATQESCFGACDAVATPTITGGVEPITVDWGGFDPNALCVGSYTATATDANNCSISFPFDVTGPEAITLNVNVTPESCFGACDAVATPTTTGGVEPITIDWGGFDPNALCVGSYTATATDANNCSISFPFEVTGPEAITLDVTATTESCFGACDAVATATTTGGVEPITIDWGGFDPNALCVGSYTATATDANSCSVSFPFDVTGPEAFSITVETTVETCFEACDGTATPLTIGGVEPITIDWGGADPAALCAGDYSIIATDANDCPAFFDFTIIEATPINLTAFPTPVGCAGEATGSVYAEATGGNGGFTYSFTDTDGNVVADNGLLAGDYFAIATDAQLCETSVPFTIEDGDEITLETNKVDVSCAGAQDGQASVVINGTTTGVAVWTDVDGNPVNPDALSGGDYTVVVTDANLCTATAEVNILEPEALVGDCESTPETDAGLENGTATVTVTGGLEPYSYEWLELPGETGSSVDPVAPNTYTVIITDANNCSITVTCDVMGADCEEFVITVPTQDVSCYGYNDGSASATVTGGDDNYTFEWLDSDSNPVNENELVAGSYTLMVTDGANCTGSQTFEILEPALLEFVGGCDDTVDGTITVYVTGGTGDYTYSWTNDVSTTDSASGLEPGDYTIIVTDENDCTAELTCNIPDVDCTPMTLTLEPTHLLCNGDTDGSVTLAVEGGVGPFEYDWSVENADGLEVNDLGAGSISVTVTDSEDCSQTTTVEITEPEPLQLGDCGDTSTGTVTVSVTGGAGGYIYAWTPDVSSSETATGLDPGDYVILITDANGCTIEQTCNVPTTPPDDCEPFVLSGTEMPETCFENADGSIELNIDGGIPPFEYSWTPDSASGANPTGLAPGTYTVIVTSSDDCTQTATFEILPATELTAEAVATQLNCDGTGEAAITVSVTNGDGPFSYTWTPNVSSTESATGLDPGEYNIEVSDGSGCIATTSAIINESSTGPEASVTSPPQLCDSEFLVLDFMAFGQGAITVNYTINGAAFSSDDLSNGLPFTQSYPLSTFEPYGETLEIILTSVEDENTDEDCNSTELSETISVTVISAIATSGDPVETCTTDNTAYTVEFEISGGDPSTYTIDSGSGNITSSPPYIFTSDEIPNGTEYNISISDASGCLGVTVSGNHNCDCETMAGTLDVTPIDVCENQIATVSISIDPTLDIDDTSFFVLHDNPGGTIGTGLQYSLTGEFTFNPPLVHNTTYYASMVVGNADGQEVDLDDPCLDVSPGVPITFYPFPVVDAGNDDATCSTDYQLQAILDNGATGLWEIIDDGGTNLALSDLTDPNAMATVESFGTVELNWTTSLADCSDEATLYIEFLENVTTEVEPGASVCNTTDGAISSTTDLSELIISGVSTGTWTDVTGSGASATGTTYDFDGVAAGTYTFNYTTPDSGGCPSESFDVEITVEDCTTALACPTLLTTAEGNNEICEGESVDLTIYESMITVDDPDGTYDGIGWFADDAHSQPIDAVYTPEYVGSCDPQFITVYPGVLCDLSGLILAAGAIDITIYPTATGELELSSSGCELVAQLDCPNFEFDGTGIFQTIPEDYTEVTLEIYNTDAVAAGLEPCGSILTNSFNCDELIKYVSLPNAFSPNGDGMNDFFRPLEMTGVNSVRLKIFNRWGEKVYSTQDMYHQGWDGTFNGVDQELGVYAYIMEATFFDGKQKMLKGNVTLIR